MNGTRKLLFLCYIVLLLSYFNSVYGQRLFDNHNQVPRASYGGFMTIEVPVYKSKEDSIRIQLADNLLSKFSSQVPLQQKKVDSVYYVRNELYYKGILYFKNIYFPRNDFVPFDSLSFISDKLTVTRLSISSRKLKRIPPEVLQCANLEVLELVNCKLGKLQLELNDLHQLQKIQILNNTSRHKLKLSKNSRVKHLAIRGDNPSSLPRSFKKFEALTKLDLSENKIIKFTNAARYNRKLIELDLQRNLITLKENNIKPHKWLERIGMQYNKISYIPSSIKNFSNAKKLGFNHNSINEVTPAIGQLNKLEELSFYSNKLEAVPQGVYAIQSLKALDLFHNRIFVLENKITNWQQLHSLYVSHNHLTTLPPEISKLTALQEIYAYDNSLKELPSSLCDIKALKVLRVNINEIKTLPICFDKLINMEELDLSDNFITDLPISIFSFPHLKILAIVDNLWNATLKMSLPARVKKLRDQRVSVHMDSYGEEEN